MNIRELVRPHIRELTPYSSARDEYSGKVGIFLDANENPLGSVGGGDFSRYPDPHQRAIKARLAQIKKVNENQDWHDMLDHMLQSYRRVETNGMLFDFEFNGKLYPDTELVFYTHMIKQPVANRT